ncbi:3'-5' exonuclease [Desulfonatronovibrio magnus]|uniref:3'-5' exonuclease n=1 Tax=Desulfonatronovibrio magnus TaxID=698827 RepID=UPI0005EAF6AE|nr:3'-5' exonuclease [Desulfonatronovibrio magnus]
MTHPHIKVAISSDFLDSFSKIPPKKQSRVANFVQKFQSNPMLPGINYEKINVAADSNYRSVRIDDAYRGIVLKPAKGNVYVLLWVDQHDDAYSWARNKKCTINPETGSIQIYESVFEAEPQEDTFDLSEPCLFDGVHDRHLKKMGVPEELLPKIRNIRTMKQLEAMSSGLPHEAYEALYFLAEGFSVEEVFNELINYDQPSNIDRQDIAQALEHPDSKRRFRVVADDKELMAMLEAPLEKWRVFLHPAQRMLVERSWNGPVRAMGGAGTGKTVAALHRAKWLAENIFNQNSDKILFTTFTRNLAADLEFNLEKICSADGFSKIEVVNLDRWVNLFLRQNGYEFDISYDGRHLVFWEKALKRASGDLSIRFDKSFFREEWEHLIQSEGITTLQQYLDTDRTGRGIRISRKERVALWAVFEEYRLLLNDNMLKEPDDAMHDALVMLENNPGLVKYSAAIVDEAQDMGPLAFRLLRQLVPESANDLFIAGDAHQRIYRRKAVLGRCGINIRGRGKKLRINYRTTEENRIWAESIISSIPGESLGEAQKESNGYLSMMHGLQPAVHNLPTFEDEITHILKHIQALEQAGEDLSCVCLAVRTNKILEQYKERLEDLNIDVIKILPGDAISSEKKGLRLATMHRVKGLEFDHMIIASVNKTIVPYDSEHFATSDEFIARDNEVMERSLLYVAATRARKTLLVTSYGEPSKFLGFKDESL